MFTQQIIKKYTNREYPGWSIHELKQRVDALGEFELPKKASKNLVNDLNIIHPNTTKKMKIEIRKCKANQDLWLAIKYSYLRNFQENIMDKKIMRDELKQNKFSFYREMKINVYNWLDLQSPKLFTMDEFQKAIVKIQKTIPMTFEILQKDIEHMKHKWIR